MILQLACLILITPGNAGLIGMRFLITALLPVLTWLWFAENKERSKSFEQLEECDDICWLTCWGVFELPDTDKYLVPLRGSPNVFPDPFGRDA